MYNFMSHRMCPYSSIRRTIPLTFAVGATAIYLGDLPIAAVCTIVGTTSVLYWYNPVHGWRRNMDMACIGLCLAYNACLARCRGCSLPYGAAVSLGALSYAASKRFSSVRIHCLVHVFGNVGNVILIASKLKLMSILYTI
jgi:hypothetical protein